MNGSRYPASAPKDLQNVFLFLFYILCRFTLRNRNLKRNISDEFLLNIHRCYWQKMWSSQGQQTQPSLLNLPAHNKRRIVAPVCPTTTRPLFVSLLPPPELRAGRAAALRREKWVISTSFVSVTSRFITVIWNEWDALGAFFAASQRVLHASALSRIRSDCRSFSGKNKERMHWFGQNSGPFRGILMTACHRERCGFLWSGQKGDRQSLTERDTWMHKQMRYLSWAGFITMKHAGKWDCYKWIQRIQVKWFISSTTGCRPGSSF